MVYIIFPTIFVSCVAIFAIFMYQAFDTTDSPIVIQEWNTKAEKLPSDTEPAPDISGLPVSANANFGSFDHFHCNKIYEALYVRIFSFRSSTITGRSSFATHLQIY